MPDQRSLLMSPNDRGDDADGHQPQWRSRAARRYDRAKRQSEYMDAHPFQRIALGLAVFGSALVFACTRIVIINRANSHLPWWSDGGGILAAFFSLGLLWFSISRKLLTRNPQASGGVTAICRGLLVVMMLTFSLGLPNRYGSGYGIPPSIQVLSDAVLAMVCLVVLTYVVRLAVARARGRASG